MNNNINSIVFIGAGNVAVHLATAFSNAGKSIVQIYNRSIESAESLAVKVNARYTNNILSVEKNADLYIISVTDSALPDITKLLNFNDKLCVHTSGFHSIDVIKNISSNIGVFYPLQSFSKKYLTDFSNVPICLEASSADNLKTLEILAKMISQNIEFIDSEKRRKLHLSAIFANNFTNYMYSIADDILKESDISFNILKPLILETASKIVEGNPYEMQTGPARRNDIEVMNNHLEMLGDTEYREVYKIISEYIRKKYK